MSEQKLVNAIQQAIQEMLDDPKNRIPLMRRLGLADPKLRIAIFEEMGYDTVVIRADGSVVLHPAEKLKDE